MLVLSADMIVLMADMIVISADMTVVIVHNMIVLSAVLIADRIVSSSYDRFMAHMFLSGDSEKGCIWHFYNYLGYQQSFGSGSGNGCFCQPLPNRWVG